jgi:hypothetical protein
MMDTINPVLAVLAAAMLRLALPVAITAIGIYFLRRLDIRWQTEAEGQLLLPVVEKTKCWEIHNCSDEDKENCAGYKSEEPCWQAHRKANGYLQEDCIGCEVFQTAPVPVNI